METQKLKPIPNPFQTTVEVPGCLSYTTRSLIIASMTLGEVIIKKPLFSDDVKAMIACLKTFGIQIDMLPNKDLLVSGSFREVKKPKKKTQTPWGEADYFCDVSLSGRTARSIVPYACLFPGIKIITGAPAFLKRPIGEQVRGLEQLGAKVEYLDKKGHLPIKINSYGLKPGVARMKGNISAQFFAGIMMIAPLVGEIILEVEGNQVSKPYIDITVDIMKTFGVGVINENYKRYIVSDHQIYIQTEYTVEGDYSSVGYLAGIATLTKSKLKLLNLNPNTVQGDRFMLEILEKMGNKITYGEDYIEYQGVGIKGVKVNMEKAIDQPPTLAVLASFANKETTITGIGILKHKESNRLKVTAQELKKMGVKTKITEDTLTIYPGKPKGARIATHNDHRIAMSFAMVGSVVEGVEIEDPSVVNKSYPDFWKELSKIGCI